MCALGSPLFPNFGWESTEEYESYNIVGDNNSKEFLDFQVPKTYGMVHRQTSLGVTVSSETTIRSLSRSLFTMLINERNRRKKTNSLFSALRSCLPGSDERLSNPQTISRSMQYIPELKEQVKKLTQKKENLLLLISRQRERYASYAAAKEEDGFVLVDVSSSNPRGERLFYTLHLQVDKIDNYKPICEELSQRVLFLYEKCGNSIK
ncbi:hypothetical protein BRARA_G00711 [Brassica rapa]|uniref:BHLH domain-containing protein n=1 Tax=Brassica campestris TaxID=3711 RepID=A0A397YIL6_BRACM|nr:hypothetical protein BRARA_G00711 [Brassica rapa]